MVRQVAHGINHTKFNGNQCTYSNVYNTLFAKERARERRSPSAKLLRSFILRLWRYWAWIWSTGCPWLDHPPGLTRGGWKQCFSKNWSLRDKSHCPLPFGMFTSSMFDVYHPLTSKLETATHLCQAWARYKWPYDQRSCAGWCMDWKFFPQTRHEDTQVQEDKYGI